MIRWLGKLGALFRRQHLDDELDEELRFHLDAQIDDNINSGMSPQEARRVALRDFGGVEQTKEAHRDTRGIPWIESLWRDLRYAVRGLRRNPGFTATAVLTLALGIGVNTVMFGVVNTVLLRPLPYAQPDRLMRMGRAVTMQEFAFWKEHSRSLSSIAGYRGGGERRLVREDGDEWISTVTVTADFLRTLSVPLAAGREFQLEEINTAGPQTIILSDDIWRRSFAADPEVLGDPITLNETIYTVVGVLPADFWFSQSADVLLPLRPGESLLDGGMNTQLIARLDEGATLAQAQAEMAVISESYRQANAGNAAFPSEFADLILMPYQESLVGDVRMNLLLLFGATGLLLLIACANLATLLLTRLAARGKELAVRLALGSSRMHLLAQFFVENLLIATLGAGAGLFAAYGLLQALVAWIPFSLPASTPIRLDRAALGFTAAVTAATALAFTLVPLLEAGRLRVYESLKVAGRGAAGRVRARTRSVLIVSEVALSTTLLVAAGLLMHSLYRLHQEPLGFDLEGLITFRTPLEPPLAQNAVARLDFSRSMLERLSALPGVRGVAVTNMLPLAGWSNIPTEHFGHPEESIGGMEIRTVSPAYLELMGIPVRRGRPFTDADSGSSIPVAIVNETLARTWWSQEEALGDRLIIGRYKGQEFLTDAPREVIAIVGDTRISLQEPPRPTVFVPLTQADWLPTSNLRWVVSASSDAPLAEEIRQVVAAVHPGQRIERLESMSQLVTSTTASPRFNASLFGVFAAVALALAVVGVYGLLSFLVTQRYREIGTRMALGATRANVLALFFRQGILLTATGLGVGILAASVLTRWLASLLFGVQTNDLFTFAAASLVLLTAALAATYIPARRAANVEPMTALRTE